MESVMGPKRVDVKQTKKEADGSVLAALGMLAGAALGAVLGLIYSRGTGEQNRRDLNLWAHHRLDDLQRKVEGVVKREGADGNLSMKDEGQ
jgi:hypothetical protein